MAVKKKAASPRRSKPARAPEPVAVPAAANEAAPVEPAPESPVYAEPAAEAKPAAPRRSKTVRYLLPANMEIAALGPVHGELVALQASNDGPFILDGANLSVIDTAGLQLLISFVSAVKSSGKKVNWDNYSVQAYQLANELGLVDQLGD